MHPEFLPPDDGEELLAAPPRRRLTARTRAIAVALLAAVALGSGAWWFVTRDTAPASEAVTVGGTRLADPQGVLAGTERRFTSWVVSRHGRAGGSATCWFVRAEGATDVDPDVLCGPVQLPNGDPRRPYADFRFATFDDASGLRAVVSDAPLENVPVAASPGVTLVRPDGEAAPLRDAGFAAPPPPDAPDDAVVQTDQVSDELPAAPAHSGLGSAALSVPLLRSGPVTSYGTGADERVAPPGDELLAVDLAFSDGERSFQLPSVDLAVAVAGEPGLRPLHVDPATVHLPGQLFAVAVPPGADVELLSTDRGITQRLSLRTGAPGPDNIALLRDGAHPFVLTHAYGRTTATIDDGHVFTAPLDVETTLATRWFFLPGSLKHPARDMAYLSVSVQFGSQRLENPTSIYALNTDRTTLTPAGGRPIPLRSPDGSSERYFVVPADLTDATLTIAGADRSSYGFRLTIDTPLQLHVHLPSLP